MERARRRRTRNQRKRDFIRDAVLVAVMVVLWLAVGAFSLKTWAEHPAEQPISYAEHMESIRGGDC